MDIEKNLVATACLAALAVAGCKPAAPPAPKYSASELLGKCKSAYSNLASYQGRTEVQTSTTSNGAPFDMKSQATIKFVTPNKLKVSGSGAMGLTFEILGDGQIVWQKTSIGGGKWEKSESFESSIASFTGISNQACTTIPACLLNTMWGSPFGQIDSAAVNEEQVRGIPTYHIKGKQVPGTVELWIDSKTFLLVRRSMKMDTTSLPDLGVPIAPEVKDAIKGLENMTTVEEYVNVRINEIIDNSVFVKPAK